MSTTAEAFFLLDAVAREKVRLAQLGYVIIYI